MTQLGPGDICFQPQDWSFIYPLGCNFLYPFYAGAAVVLPTGRFDPEQTFEAVEELAPGSALPADKQGVAFYPEDE